MSDSFNPEIIGNEIVGFSRTGSLDFDSNPEDTFLLTLPSETNTEDLTIFYGFNVSNFALDAPVTISIGQDNNGDGVFTIANELVGNSDLNPNESIGLEDIIPDFNSINVLEDTELLLQPEFLFHRNRNSGYQFYQ